MSDLFLAAYGPALDNIIRRVNNGPVDDARRSGLAVRAVGSSAVVSIHGGMLKNDTWWGASTMQSMHAVRAAKNDTDVETIVIDFDTPGGSVDGLDQLADEIASAASVKPVIAQVSGLLASAGYYVASSATEIRAGAMDLVGSIGTKITMFDYSEMFVNMGIKPVIIDTGEHKSAGTQGTVITDSHIAEFQRIVDGYFADFRSRVMDGRGLDSAAFDAVSDGRVFFGHESASLGLIDKVSTLDQTLAELSQKGRTTQTARNRLKL